MVVGIVGLGLMGGSMAKAIKHRTEHQVLGIDLDPLTQESALREGAVDETLSGENLSRCDLLILSLYPGVTVDYLRQNAGRLQKGAVVVDLCGVKEFVCREAAPIAREQGFTFVGGHPMVGRELSGYGASKENLYQGASMLLTPDEGTDPQVVAALEDFFFSLGFGRIHHTTPAIHDSTIAYTSQLAHVLSNAYVKSPAALRHRYFSGGSFQDLTRVATLNEEMWTELFLINREPLLRELDGLCARLAAYGDALRSGDRDGLKTLLQEGCQWKKRITEEQEEQG